MICYLQASKTTKKISLPCISTQNVHTSITMQSFKPGYIYGAALIIGSVPDKVYTQICNVNAAISIFNCKKAKQKTIYCNVILDIYIFKHPIQGMSNGNAGAMKIPFHLKRCLNDQIKCKLPAWLTELKQFDATKSHLPEQRILILRKEALYQYMNKSKKAEYRTRSFGFQLLPKISSSQDLKKIKSLQTHQSTKINKRVL